MSDREVALETILGKTMVFLSCEGTFLRRLTLPHEFPLLIMLKSMELKNQEQCTER